MKNNINDEKNCQHRCCCCRRYLEILAVRPSMQLTSQILWLRPSQFSIQKGPYFCPRMSFCNRTTTQSTPPPYSRTFNCRRRRHDNPAAVLLAKCRHSTIFFSFRELSQSWRSSHCPRAASSWAWRVIWTLSEKESATAFRRWMVRGKQRLWVGLKVPK
jgi:hypothetical protein